MDKKTFIKGVEALGYEVFIYEKILKVHRHTVKDGVISTKVLGVLDLTQDNTFRVDTDDNALVKLIVEFGMTSVSERESTHRYVYTLNLSNYDEPVYFYLMRNALGQIVLEEYGDNHIKEDVKSYEFTETMITQYSDAMQALFAESKKIQ